MVTLWKERNGVLMKKKRTYPFRIGCTSYVIGADIIPNVEYMADYVDDVELVLFESCDMCNFPRKEDISELRRIANSQGLSYSVHFPIDKKAAAADGKERQDFFEQVKAVISLTHELQPSGYLLHLEGISKHSTKAEISDWENRVDILCSNLVTIPELDPSLLCVETLGYAPEYNYKIVQRYGLSFCIDIGHLWLYEMDWKSSCDKMIGTTRIIHLHGVQGGKDHLSLAVHDKPQLRDFVQRYLRSYRGVLTLELFDENHTFESLQLMEQLWQKQY